MNALDLLFKKQIDEYINSLDLKGLTMTTKLIDDRVEITVKFDLPFTDDEVVLRMKNEATEITELKIASALYENLMNFIAHRMGVMFRIDQLVATQQQAKPKPKIHLVR